MRKDALKMCIWRDMWKVSVYYVVMREFSVAR
jgi:hypothetical protein